VRLSASLLFAHASGVSVRGAAPLAASDASATLTCPVDADGKQCSGRGLCELSACTCEQGWAGRACETALCGEDGCGAHGQCLGAGGCQCEAGWRGATCAEAECASDCSGRGSCLNGVCACDQGFTGVDCSTHTSSACPDSCSGHGNCAVAGSRTPICLCHSRFVGVTCALEVGCPTDCNDNGRCVDGECMCYRGYSGEACEAFCPHNCTLALNFLGSYTSRGRCSMDHRCICKEGFSGPDCSQECPSRCFGHGECVDGECVCRDGYEGYDCGDLQPMLWKNAFLAGFAGYYPLLFVALVALIGLLAFCCLGYCFNRWRGRFGTSAVPMFDFYAKRWRNAPLFEPIFAVSAATQTPKGNPYPDVPVVVEQLKSR